MSLWASGHHVSIATQLHNSLTLEHIRRTYYFHTVFERNHRTTRVEYVRCTVAIGDMHTVYIYCVLALHIYSKKPKLFDTWHFQCANNRGKMPLSERAVILFFFFLVFFLFCTLSKDDDTENRQNCFMFKVTFESKRHNDSSVECRSIPKFQLISKWCAADTIDFNSFKIWIAFFLRIISFVILNLMGMSLLLLHLQNVILVQAVV